jgi:hypothetical protein
MRINKYYGTLWIVFQGKNPRYNDDILSFQIENLFRTKKEFQLFSISFIKKIERFNLTFLSIRIKIYTR